MDLLTSLLIGGLLGLGLAVYGIRSGLKNNHTFDWLRSKQLSDNGINLEIPRELEFYLFVRTMASAKYIDDELTKEGYTVRFEEGKAKILTSPQSKESEEDGIRIVASKVVTIYGDSLKKIRARLTPLAEKENGRYEGWLLVDRVNTPHIEDGSRRVQ